MDIREKILNLFRQKYKVQLEVEFERISKISNPTTQDIVIFAMFKFGYNTKEFVDLVSKGDSNTATSLTEIINNFDNNYGVCNE